MKKTIIEKLDTKNNISWLIKLAPIVMFIIPCINVMLYSFIFKVEVPIIGVALCKIYFSGGWVGSGLLICGPEKDVVKEKNFILIVYCFSIYIVYEALFHYIFQTII